MRTQTPNSLADFVAALFRFLHFARNGFWWWVFLLCVFCCFFRLVLSVFFSLLSVECIVYNWHGLCANRKQDYGSKIQRKATKKNSQRPSDSKTLTNHNWCAHTNGKPYRMKKKTNRSSSTATLTFWLINYAHIQINTVLAMSHTHTHRDEKSVEKTVTLHSIWMWIMLFMTHDKIVCAFCSVHHHSTAASFPFIHLFMNPFIGNQITSRWNMAAYWVEKEEEK